MKYYLSLFQKLKNIYQSISINQNELALICPSLRVYEENEMKMLLPSMLVDTTLKAEALLKKEDISYQLNSLPTSDLFWDVNPDRNLFEVYNRLVYAEQKFDLTTTDTSAQSVLFDSKNKPTAAKKKYDNYLKLWEKLVTDYDNHFKLYDENATDESMNLWHDKLNLLHTKKELLFAEFKLLGFKDVIENALITTNQSNDFDSFLLELNAIKSALENAKKTGIDSLATYLDLQFIPYNFMDTNNGWSTLTLDKSQLEQLYGEIKTDPKNIFSDDILSIDYDEKYIKGIELEYAIVSLKRNWFNPNILSSKFYKTDETLKIADGQNISNELLLPAFPKKMILVRNLKINLNDTVTTNQVDDLNQIIHFGPLIMKNHLFVNGQTNVKFLKPIKNKLTLTSENVKTFSKKNETTKTITSNELKLTTATSLKPTARVAVATNLSSTTPVKPINTLVKPLVVQPLLFNTIDLFPVKNPLTKVNITTKDKFSQDTIYKSEVSITGTNITVFKEIETDQNGIISCDLPIGNYNVQIRKDGYGILNDHFQITDKNPVSKEYILIPESVQYNTYFLIGMICEKLPKLPVS